MKKVRLEGLLRLRVGRYRVFFKEDENLITIYGIRDRKEAYR